MTIETAIANYGYAAVALGTFIEGETLLILGGVAAHQGYLDLVGVLIAGLAGSVFGDQLFYFLGRRHSEWLLTRFRSWGARSAKAECWLNRHETLTILTFRFVYGMRAITPFMLGVERIGYLKFTVLELASALVWSVAIGVAGYFFGGALESLMGEIKHYERLSLALILLAGAAFWLYRFIRRRRHENGPRNGC